MRKTYLKIKIKSLRAKAQIIRQEELKWGRTQHPLRDALYLRRTQGLRQEARSAHLAYGFLRERRYAQLEHKLLPTTAAPDLARISALTAKYGPEKNLAKVKAALEEWFAQGQTEKALDAA